MTKFSDLIMALPQMRREGILEDLADAGVLEIPDQEDEDAEPLEVSAVREAIEKNFYDQEFIEYSIKQYDYKRGYCTLTATLEVTVDELLTSDIDLGGWTISVKTKHGNLSFGG